MDNRKYVNLLAPGVDEEELAKKADLIDGKVPASELPSYVDDVIEYASLEEFPAEGEGGKIYVALDSGFTYRWGGSEYVQIGGQDLSDYYTKTEADALLATKQAVGDYATNAALEAGLATKQAVGDYATNSALTAGLATKQPVGDYATRAELAALPDLEVVAYQDQTPLTEAQLAKAVDGKLAIYCNGRLYTKYYEGTSIINFHAFDIGHNIGSSVNVSDTMRSQEYVILLYRDTRMLSNTGAMPVSSIGDYAANFLDAATAPAVDGKKLIREANLALYATSSELTSGLAAKQDVLTTSAVPNGNNATYIGFDSNGDLKKDEFTPLSAAEIREILENAGKTYIIGFSGAAQSNPALTRTDEAVDAAVTNNNGILEISGINMNKVWGGYIGNDEEELTWDATSGKYLYNGVEYTGNVFSKINRFFTKARYVEVDGEQVLDGYQLCYADTAPDNTWQDWFLGKPYTKIGCYKARGGDDWINGLQSKQGLSGRGVGINANQIATASNLNTSTTATMHMKWYNQNSILQVLFMALFATRQTEDVFPQSTYRQYTNTQNTGYLDEMRAASVCATGYSTTKTGNMFLGIEDFVGYGFECLGGVKLNGNTVQTSLNYNTFNFSDTYLQADINISNITSGNYISSLQESVSVPGLLLPKKTTGTETTYYCDAMRTGGVPLYQGGVPNIFSGIFYLAGNFGAADPIDYWATRLCGEPL